MNEEEIRFQILYYLYNKHYSGEVGKYQSADNIIQETEMNGSDHLKCSLIDTYDEFIHLCEI
jgi:hypothetical protein